jgi:ATP-dependent exoDNAse (exonuclease V) beta subunit
MFGYLKALPGGPNHGSFQELPNELREGESATPELRLTAGVAQSRAVTLVDQEAALKTADRFFHRQLPHTLANRTDPGEEIEPAIQRWEREPDWPAPVAASPALLHGSWWHALMENMRWTEGKEGWEQSFLKALEQAPDAKRSAQEWKLFCASELSDFLRDPKLCVQPECPFLHPSSAESCVEGKIDLAVFDPERERWLIVDWKTNRIEPQAVASLLEIYGPQVRAYADSLGAITACNVDASIYSTATGHWLMLDGKWAAS